METTKIDCMYLKRFQPEANVGMSTFNWKIWRLLIRPLLIIRKVFVSFIRCFIVLCYFNSTHFHQFLKSISISLIKFSLSRAVSIFFFLEECSTFSSTFLFVLVLQSIYFTSFVVLFFRGHALQKPLATNYTLRKVNLFLHKQPVEHIFPFCWNLKK